MRVRALESFSYGVPQVDYKAGDEFETVEDMHATILEHAKKVVIVAHSVSGPTETEMTDNRRRGNYNRRDMRAKR